MLLWLTEFRKLLFPYANDEIYSYIINLGRAVFQHKQIMHQVPCLTGFDL